MRIVSWLGGENTGTVRFLRLEEAVAFCEGHSLDYEIVKDQRHYYR